MKMYSKKIQGLPPYIFGVIDGLKLEAYRWKQDVIDLAMGNPDMPTPKHIVERLCDTVVNHPRTHRYPQEKGMPKFRHAVSEWYQKRTGQSFNPDTEILTLVGSKEGIAHFYQAWLDPGDIVLFPSPCYPVHYYGVLLAGGTPVEMPITPENNYLPDLERIPDEVARKAKILVLNYPNNPTTACVDGLEFFERVVKFAKKNDIVVVHDFAYSEIAFDGYKPPSFMETPGARDIGVEFNTLSKTYNMAGWRLGYVVGNQDILKPLERLKSYLDYGVFTAIQLAGVAALTGPDDCVKEVVKEYQRRRDYFVDGLNKIGWRVEKPRATMYLWARIPEGYRSLDSLEFSKLLIERTGIAVSPGSGFGSYGEGYVRMALVTHYDRFHDALLRLKKFIKEAPVELKSEK